ncbi:MAG: TraX family protein [Pseudomonadota bacterium]|nr:TraX family protein [Pseudomonadota bacterium]
MLRNVSPAGPDAPAVVAPFDTPAAAPLVIANGTLEGLKWFAAALMILDHINRFFYGDRIEVLLWIGRIVLPIFGFVLVYNLSRPHALSRGVHQRMMFRLLLWGLAATPFYVILNGAFLPEYPWYPLNILFELLLVVALIYLLEKGKAVHGALALPLFILGGALADYWWFGVVCCLSAWLYCRKPTLPRLGLWALGTLTLTVVNRNSGALFALPVIFAATRLSLAIPRIRLAFYVLYPSHLAVILLAKKLWF